MLDLAATLNKQAIRQRWDKPIIAKFRETIGNPLSYFGLPGPDIRDFHDWGEHLGYKTGVEIVTGRKSTADEERRRINALETNILLDGFSDKWELRRGLLENIILDGVDIDGNAPTLMVVERKTAKLLYDLHNWDFQGGLGYTERGEARRVQAIKRLIELQKNHAFLFLLTLNVRHKLGEELSRYLDGTGNETYSDKHRKILHWYAQRRAVQGAEHYRTKEAVPLFVRQVAQVNSFDCFCYPPIYYQGWKEHLVHFVFLLKPQGTVLPFFSKQKLGEVIELPLIEAQEGVFKPSETQHPGYRKENVAKLLAKFGLLYKK